MCVLTRVPPTFNLNPADPALHAGEVTVTKLAVTVGVATGGVDRSLHTTKTVAPTRLLPEKVILSPPFTAEYIGVDAETDAGGAELGVTSTDELEFALTAFLSLVATTVNVYTFSFVKPVTTLVKVPFSSATVKVTAEGTTAPLEVDAAVIV